MSSTARRGNRKTAGRGKQGPTTLRPVDENLKPPSPLSMEVRRLLDQAQRTKAAHPRAHAQLQELYTASGEDFLQAFIPQLNKILVIFTKEPAVERVMGFVCEFVANPSTEPSLRDRFTNRILSHVLSLCTAKDKAVRYRVCQLIAKVLYSMADDAEIGEEEFNAIVEKMTERCRDKHFRVREQAVGALARVQDASNPEDPVLQEYLRILRGDPHKDLRRTVLEHIGLSGVTLEAILERTRDTESSVRSKAFQLLRAKGQHHMFTVNQRAQILKNGLDDRVREVRNSCVELLRSWLESLDADVLALLRSLNVGGHREVCEKAIRAIWTHRCTADLRRILTERSGEPGREPPFFPGAEEEDGEDTVTPEQALYWRVRCAVAAEADDSELLDALLPNTARLCSLTENFVSDLKQSSDRQRDLEGKLDTLQSEDGSEMSEEELEVLDAQLEEVEVLILEGLYVVKEFLSLCHFADFQDEVGRRQLKALVESMLLDVYSPQPLVEPGMQLLRRLCDDLNDEEYCTEVILLARRRIIQPSAEGGEEEEDQGVVLGAQFGWMRLLSIVGEILKLTALNLERSDSMKAILEQVILPSFAMDHPVIREQAVRCLGLYLMADHSSAFSHFPLLVQVAESDIAHVRITALQAIFDLLMTFPDLAHASSTSVETSDCGDAGVQGRIPEWNLEKAQTLWKNLLLQPIMDACHRPPHHIRTSEEALLDAVAKGSQSEEETLAEVLQDTEDRLKLLSVIVEGLCKLLIYDRFPRGEWSPADLLSSAGAAEKVLQNLGCSRSWLEGTAEEGGLQRVTLLLLLQLCFSAPYSHPLDGEEGSEGEDDDEQLEHGELLRQLRGDPQLLASQQEARDFLQQSLMVFYPAYVKSDVFQTPQPGVPSHVELCTEVLGPFLVQAGVSGEALAAEQRKLRRKRKTAAAAAGRTSRELAVWEEMLGAVNPAEVTNFFSYLIHSTADAVREIRADRRDPQAQELLLYRQRSVNSALLGLLQELALRLALPGSHGENRGAVTRSGRRRARRLEETSSSEEEEEEDEEDEEEEGREKEMHEEEKNFPPAARRLTGATGELSRRALAAALSAFAPHLAASAFRLQQPAEASAVSASPVSGASQSAEEEAELLSGGDPTFYGGRLLWLLSQIRVQTVTAKKQIEKCQEIVEEALLTASPVPLDNEGDSSSSSSQPQRDGETTTEFEKWFSGM